MPDESGFGQDIEPQDYEQEEEEEFGDQSDQSGESEYRTADEELDPNDEFDKKFYEMYRSLKKDIYEKKSVIEDDGHMESFADAVYQLIHDNGLDENHEIKTLKD